MASELVIKINGDIKGFSDALEQASGKTEALSDELSSIAKVSAVAFAALTAGVGASVTAFADSQAASNSLVQAMQNAGVYSDELAESYDKQAKKLQFLTGIDDDAIAKAQATVQAMIGQQQITEDLTKSIADLSVGKGMDIEASAELIAKGINGQTTALGKLGIEIDDHLTKEERTIQIIEKVNLKFGGMAEAANQGLGGIKGLSTEMGTFLEAIGERFAPFVEAAIDGLTEFFQTLSGNKDLMDFVVSMAAAGVAVTGTVTVVATAALGFLKLQAALEAASVATGVMSLGVKGLVGATGIGLLVLALTEVYLNWESIWPRMQASFTAFTENVGAVGQGLSMILGGVFSLDTAKISEGLEQVKAAFNDAYTGYNDIVEEKLAEKATIEEEAKLLQDEAKLAAAEEEAARVEEQNALELEIIAAQNEAKMLQAQEASAAVMEFKKQEIEMLNAAAAAKHETDKANFLARAAELSLMGKTQMDADKAQLDLYNAEILQKNKAFQDLSAADQKLFLDTRGKNLQTTLDNERTAQQKAVEENVKNQIAANNEYLKNQKEFGTAYAEINDTMNSNQFKGAKQAFGELAQLQRSENATLKAIGKAAAIANVTIKTAESAMNVFAGFSAAIPGPVGVALGIAGAAAAVAFGAFQIGEITAAANGGIMTGGIPGMDSIPTMTMPGELVAPVKNFEEVIGSVRAQREAEKMGGVVGGSGAAQVVVGFDGREASQVLTMRQVEDRALGVSVEGSTV